MSQRLLSPTRRPAIGMKQPRIGLTRSDFYPSAFYRIFDATAVYPTQKSGWTSEHAPHEIFVSHPNLRVPFCSPYTILAQKCPVPLGQLSRNRVGLTHRATRKIASLTAAFWESDASEGRCSLKAPEYKDLLYIRGRRPDILRLNVLHWGILCLDTLRLDQL